MFSFYQFASAVNSRLAVIQEEQEMLQNVTVEEGQTSANAQRLTLLVREAVLRNGSLVAQMCEQMARYKAICSFSELPDNLFTT
jgi:alpha-D-ribose 1-methylphosphonate 5-triphosphate synthase subunit PhnH